MSKIPAFISPDSKYSREAGFIKAAYKRTISCGSAFVLLLLAGAFYIWRFEKGLTYAVCYTVLPIVAGFVSFLFVNKYQVEKHIAASSVKACATYLCFFAAHILALALLVKPTQPTPELLITYIPVVYALYCMTPFKNVILKLVICSVFWAGATALLMLRPTAYAGSLLSVHFSIFVVSISAVKNGCFGNTKWKNYASIIGVFLLLLLITPFDSIAAPSDISVISAFEVLQNIGFAPSILLGVLYLALILGASFLAIGKSGIIKGITVAVTASFASVLFLNAPTVEKFLGVSPGLPFLQSTELSTCFTVAFCLIILTPNGSDIAEHAFHDSIMYDSRYTGKFRVESYGAKLLIIQGASGSGKTRFLSDVLISSEPGQSFLFSMETAYERFVHAIRRYGVCITDSPELVFPEISDGTAALLIIDDVDLCLRGRPSSQAAFAKLLLAIIDKHGISVGIAGIDLKKRIPCFWEKLIGEFNGTISYEYL